MSNNVAEKLARASEHNAAMLAHQRRALAGVAVTERIAALRDGIERAGAIGRRLRRLPDFNERLEHLRVFTACLDEVQRAGLLEPGRAARRAAS